MRCDAMLAKRHTLCLTPCEKQTQRQRHLRLPKYRGRLVGSAPSWLNTVSPPDNEVDNPIGTPHDVRRVARARRKYRHNTRVSALSRAEIGRDHN